jgi:MFS family permease
MLVGVLAGGLLTWLLITDSLRDFGISLYQNFEPLLLQNYGFNEAQIGLVFSLFALVYALSSISGSRLADRWSVPGALALSGFVHAGAIGILVFIQTIPATLGYFVLSGLAFGLADLVFDAMLALSAPARHIGMAFGLFRTAISVAAMPAPFIGDTLWEHASPLLPFALGGRSQQAEAVLTWIKLRPQVEQLQPAVQEGD